uniref:WS/DGAT/MGAT family O-acyltransferase n=1 Tax=Patulibacter defluvii TaxID=3095358 RepID=UPI002A754754|nr:wax ester/triacylglycerol synthase family O-acyltransferase [Patulibacter sp. DM4]
MRQLTSLDAQFLAAEDGRTHGHVSAVAILDPSTTASGRLTLADVRRVFRERLHLLPPLRWRLVRAPLDLDYPYWHDDPAFDLEFHVRELQLPRPGTMDQLADQVARIIGRPLDRSRPLWEVYLIDGLADGNVALLTKVHHALVDGMSGAEILGILFDLEPEGRTVAPDPEHGPDRRAGTLELVARGVGSLPRQALRLARGVPATLQHIDTLPTLRHVPGARLVARVGEQAHRAATRNRDGRMLERPRARAPRTSFNGRITPHRRVAFASLSLPEIKAVKNAFGATVNDVVVTLCAAAVREWLVDHGELPEDPLLAMVPISVRTKEELGTFGNRISVMIAPLPTDEPDPAERLRRTHEAMRSAKERHRAVPADILSTANHLIPPSLFARAARVTAGVSASSRFAPPYNLILSNVPGPPVPIYIAGARQVANYPVSFILDGVGLNITVFSYLDRVDFGLVADRDLLPDVAALAGALERAIDDLTAAARTLS